MPKISDRPNGRKSKLIAIRVDESMYKFLREISDRTGVRNVSEIVRKVLEYFFLSYSLDRIKEPITKLREEFYRKYTTNLRDKENAQG